jgi:hypothetical protein
VAGGVEAAAIEASTPLPIMATTSEILSELRKSGIRNTS